MQFNLFQLSVVLALLLNYASPLRAAVNDVFPGDYYPTQLGQTLLTLYAFDRTQTGPYMHGNKFLDGEINSQTFALRLTHGFLLGSMTATPVLVLPWVKGDITPAPLAAALGGGLQGVADMRIGLTLWPINDRERAIYLGLSAMLIAPTGDYDKTHILNPGENRWKALLSGGWQKDITPQLLIELSPEIVFYGDNKDYAGNRRLEQQRSAALTGYLRYRMSPAWHGYVGGQINRGGETRIANVDQHNPANNDRVMAGLTWFLPEGQQVILRAAKDLSIDNGFRTHREIALRYLKSF